MTGVQFADRARHPRWDEAGQTSRRGARRAHQFLPDDGDRNLAALGLGVTFSALTTVIYGAYAFGADHLRHRLAGPRTYTVLRTIAGVVFLALAANTVRIGVRH